MIIILNFFNTLLLPILVLCFVGFGLAAAITSAMIEAVVFSMILTGGNQTAETTLIAWIIIGGFEASKLVATYLKTSPARNNLTMNFFFRFARPAFGFISLVATFAFVCNSLYASMATTASLDNIQQNISDLRNQITSVESQNYDPSSDSRLESYRETLRVAITLAEAHQNEWGADSYMEDVSSARDELNNKITTYQKEFETKKEQKINSLTQEIEELNAKMDLTDAENLRANNNLFLDRTLSLIWQIFTQRDYPQIAYWITAIVISLILGCGIEFVINGTLSFLAQSQEQLKEAFHVCEETSKAYSWIVRTILQFACGLSFMLLFALALRYSTSSISFNWGLSSLALITGLPLVNWLFDRKPARPHEVSTSLSKIKRTLLGFKENGKHIGVTSAVLIVIYFLIGALTRSVDPSDMSIPQVAALLVGAIGSSTFSSVYNA